MGDFKDVWGTQKKETNAWFKKGSIYFQQIFFLKFVYHSYVFFLQIKNHQEKSSNIMTFKTFKCSIALSLD